MEINKCANTKFDCMLNKGPAVAERMLQYVYCIHIQQLLLLTKGSIFGWVMYTGRAVSKE
jgi:hypothetical protein